MSLDQSYYNIRHPWPHATKLSIFTMLHVHYIMDTIFCAWNYLSNFHRFSSWSSGKELLLKSNTVPYMYLHVLLNTSGTYNVKNKLQDNIKKATSTIRTLPLLLQMWLDPLSPDKRAPVDLWLEWNRTWDRIRNSQCT